MTSFVHVDYPTQHPGVVRAERAIATVRQLANRIDGTRTLATLLLAAIVSALLVVANQVVETWTEGHLLAAWIVLWTVGFAALGLLAVPARNVVRTARASLQRAAHARRRAAQDNALWQAALSDTRLMAELSHAMSRDAARDVRGYL